MEKLPEMSADRSRYRENAVHGTPQFPMKLYTNNFQWYTNHVIDWHWHPELEFAVVLEGSVDVSVNDSVFTVSEGEGFFINSNTMHMERPAEDSPEPLMATVCFMPEFIGDCGGDLIYRRYVAPVVSDPFLRGMKLIPQIGWQSDILAKLREMYAVHGADEWGTELLLRNSVAQMWYVLAVNLRVEPQDTQLRAAAGLSEQRLKTMLSFIQENYSRELTVDEIAASANISRSECFRCFRSMISKKPVAYLNEYRLKAAAELLLGTDMQITEICFACGFGHSSYFGKMFRQYYGVTPKQFRIQSRSLSR
ncbi:MAG: helix-turn-helix transcriptional regulator [Ruminococcus sp.]|nr:helix-turn-helix transcriptional regulator [Ruminococcus sp.]